MKLIVDCKIAKTCAWDGAKILQNSLLSDPGNQVCFRWPTLLEYLELGAIFSNLAPFNPTSPLFEATIGTLFTAEENEVLFYVYDRLFTECLNQIRSLPPISASFLLRAIEEKKVPELEKILSPALNPFETALLENPSCATIDLTLYLAWDRMCVWMGNLFNFQSTHERFIENLNVLKECLIESYQHISRQGQTTPGIYRMIEALFTFQMRDENLQKHSPTEWTLLNQSFQALKGQDELLDLFYIDEAAVLDENLEPKSSECYLTLDSPETVNNQFALSQFMMDKLKAEVPQWSYALQTRKILSLTL